MTERTTEELLIEYAAHPEDVPLRTMIINRHAVLVRVMAAKFARPQATQEDLTQVAWLALITAVDRFDPNRGTKFSSYAVACIVGEIKHYFSDNTWSVQAPRRFRTIASSLPGRTDRLVGRLQRKPTMSELAAEFKVDEATILAAMEVGRICYSTLAIDMTPDNEGEGGLSMGEMVGERDGRLENIVQHAQLYAALKRLDYRKQNILRLRHFKGYTQEEVAQQLGISKVQVGRLEDEAIRELRRVWSTA